MSHPFFDSPTYPWDRPDAKSLHKLLFSVIQMSENIRHIYEGCIGSPPPLDLAGGAEIIWKRTLDTLASSGGLQKLCKTLQDRGELQSSTFQSAVLAVINAQSIVVTGSISLAHLISDDVLVLDRENLSQHLLKFKEPNPVKSVLVVLGESASGKSHGRWLFELAAQEVGALPVYLDRDLMPTVDIVLKKLFGPLNASARIPKRDSTSDAWYGTACLGLYEAAVAEKKRLWIAVDDLGNGPDGGPLVDQEIRKFFEQFALNMKDPAFRNWFRLKLIHFPVGSNNKLPARWDRSVCLIDMTKESDVQIKHAIALLRIWLEENGLNMTEQDVVNHATDVMDQASVPLPATEEQIPRLQRIHDALVAKLSSLRSPLP